MQPSAASTCESRATRIILEYKLLLCQIYSMSDELAKDVWAEGLACDDVCMAADEQQRVN